MNTALRTYAPIAALLAGALMVVIAFVQAGSIPQRAHDDFGALIPVAAGAFGLTLRPLSLRPPTGLATGAPQREPPDTVT